MSKVITITALALFAVLLMGTGAAQAESSSWTGCVTRGGTIVHLAWGDTPAKPCSSNERLLHLRDEEAIQTHQATFDQKHLCEAFHALNLSAPALEKLGCPSTPTLRVEGVVSTHLSAADFSRNNFDVCGILQVKTDDQFSPWWYWNVKGGFVAQTTQLPVLVGDYRQVCRSQCANDTKCIAAWLEWKDVHDEFATCRIFHHSDALAAAGNDWHHICGLSQDRGQNVAAFGCGDLAQSARAEWFIREPKLGDIGAGNCPGPIDTTP